VAITSLRNDIYYAMISVKARNRIHEVDARPSDALNLALRVKAPIFVTPELMEQATRLLLRPDNISEGLETIRRTYVRNREGMAVVSFFAKRRRTLVKTTGEIASYAERQATPIV